MALSEHGGDVAAGGSRGPGWGAAALLERVGAAGVAALAFTLGVGGLALLGHWLFLTKAYDLGLYVHALHQAARGTTFNALHADSFLGIHTHWIHFLFTPFAFTGWATEALLILQTIAVAAGGLGIARYGRLRGLSSGQAAAVAVAFLASPLTQFPSLWGYHPEVLGVAFLAWAAVFLEERRLRPFLLMVVLLAACKETCGILLAGLGVVTLFDRRVPRVYGASALAAGLVAFGGGLLVIGVANTSNQTPASMFGPLGSTTGEVVWTVVSSPRTTLRYLATVERGQVVLALLGGFAFLPLLRPRWALAALPFLGVHLLSSVATVHGSVRFHYHALTVTCLTLAATDALAAAPARRRKVAATALLTAGIGLHFLVSPVLEHPLWRNRDWVMARSREWSRAVAAIPPDGPVIANAGGLAHLADRERVYYAIYAVRGLPYAQGQARPLPSDHADYFIIDVPFLAPLRVHPWLARHGEWVLERAGAHVHVYRRTSAPPLRPSAAGEGS